MIPLAAGGVALTLEPPGAIAVMAALLAASFFFSGTETALFSLQKVDRQRFANGSRAEQRVLALLSDQPSLITTLLLGNETANIALAATGAALVQGLLPAHPWVNVLIVTPLLVVVSEITPKVLAFRFNTRWARAVALPVQIFAALTWVLRLVLVSLVTGLARLFRVTPDEAQEARLKEAEIRSLVGHGAETGALDDRERQLIEAVFDFDDLTVARVMTPAPDVFRLSLDEAWPEVLRRCRDEGYSRVPIYDGDLDDIVGVLTLKDLLGYRARPPASLRRVRTSLRPALFVPLSKPATDMMREFLERQLHMAIVVDEHGTLVGIVTLDDLLGELDLGEEDDETASEIVEQGPRRIKVSPRMDVGDFTEETGIELPEGDYHTVGGYVFHRLGRLPRAGDVVDHDGHRFVVEGVESRRITGLHVLLAAAEVAS